MNSGIVTRVLSAVTCLIAIFFLAAQCCLGSEFLMVKHFESPFGEGVGDLTYNDDGYLYATAKSLLKYGDRIYKIDPENGTYVDFFKHPSEPSNELKYITSCNGTIYVDHYPLVLNHAIYKLYPDEDIWTTFFEPENTGYGGIACDGSNLIIAEQDYIYTISLLTQEETGRNKFITIDAYEGMTWDGAYLWALTTNDTLHKIDAGRIIEERALPATLKKCRGLAYDGECFWTYVSGLLSPYSQQIVQLKPLEALCPAEMVYGEDSPEAELLRYFRDTVLSKTHEGREIIKLYYDFSPALTGVMAGDEQLTSEIRAMLDSVLPLAKSERD